MKLAHVIFSQTNFCLLLFYSNQTSNFKKINFIVFTPTNMIIQKKFLYLFLLFLYSSLSFHHLQMTTEKPESEDSRDDSMERLEKDVGFPKRYILALMVFLGFSVLYALRVNLNVAIGAMCNNHTIYENGFYVQKVYFDLA